MVRRCSTPAERRFDAIELGDDMSERSSEMMRARDETENCEQMASNLVWEICWESFLLELPGL